MTTEINIDVKATPAPTHVLFTLKSGAEVYVPMPPAGMAGIKETMHRTPSGGTLILGIDDDNLDGIVVVDEIAAVQPSWGGLLDRVISYPRTS